MARRDPVTAIVLAAGQARRFGRDKRQATLPGGRTLLDTVVGTALQAMPRVCVVLSADDADWAAGWQASFGHPGLSWVLAPDAANGMGHSLAAGVAAQRHACAWVILLADMPWVQATTVAAVRDALVRYDLVQPVHRGQGGHPVGFSARFGQHLRKLHGDHGARGILARHCHRLHRLAVDDPGILQDVDTTADLDHIGRLLEITCREAQ